jgi:hypothetical protein
MSFGLRLVSGAVLSLAVIASPVSARGWHGGHGYYGHGYHRGGGGIGAFGGFVLGAAVIGSVAAIASSNNRDAERDYQRGYDGVYDTPAYQGDYGRDGYSEPSAYNGASDDYEQAREGRYDDENGATRTVGGDPVSDCSRAAERRAQLDGGYARVLHIDKVTNVEGGAAVRGTLEVNRGREAPVSRMAFTCTASYGDIRQLRLG